MSGSFRPWGHLPRVLNHVKPRAWSLLGCLSTEERCLSAWRLIRAVHSLHSLTLLEIDDGANRYATAAAQLRLERRNELLANGGSAAAIQSHTLFEPYGKIVEAADQFVASASEDVVLDISSLPKRFFFPLLRRLLGAGSVRTLAVTYTEGARYGDIPLSEDAEPVTSLPLFPPRFPEPPVDALVVGLGFQPLGLAEILEGTETQAIHLLFPVSSEPANHRRVWEFLRELTDTLPVGARQAPTFVAPLDAPDVFDRLVAISDNMGRYANMAPYGPKPMSLAMALAAATADWPVYYTQPRVYRPDYTIGIREIGGVAATYVYLIRLDGRNLYTRP